MIKQQCLTGRLVIFHKHIFSHSFLCYPLESQISLGSDRRGCFKPPVDDKLPTSDIDCLDIVPTEHMDNITCIEHMKEESQLVHPDSLNMNRYIMGTRIQTRGKGGTGRKDETGDKGITKSKEETENEDVS